ncbi:MAG: hypothetical protein ACREKN_04770 [Longimicrobiaceae bacterium]
MKGERAEAGKRRAEAGDGANRGGRRREELRKAIHLASVAVPLFFWFSPRRLATLALIGVAALAVAIDVSRLRLRGFRYGFLRRTRDMLRSRERKSFAGATYLALAYAAVAVLFPTPVAVAAMLYGALGDAAAALVGRRWGRHRTTGGKSWEGALAGFAVCLGVGFLIPGVSPAAALLGAAAAAGLELADLPPDDNLWVVLGGGAVLALAGALFG